MARILLVEDDRVVRETTADFLTRVGHHVTTADDGAAALAAQVAAPPEVVLLDLMLPTMSGREVLRALRQRQSDLPVIIVTARGQEHERVRGLEWGVDDYVTKPFSLRELDLRIKAVLRRRREPTALATTLRDGNLRLDLAAHTAHLNGEEVKLTGREFDLLAHLLANPGRVCSRSDLIRDVWGWQSSDDSTVTVHVRRLREKLEADPAKPVRLVTVFGVGYRWDGAADGS